MEPDKDDPSGAPPSDLAGSSPKRPHAVLDLETADVTPAAPAPTDARAEEDAPEVSKDAEVEASAAPRPEPSPRLDKTADQTRARDAPRPRLGSALATHLAAGLLGGAAAAIIFALSATDAARRAGASAPPEGVSAIERRLATLEQAMPMAAPPQLAEKLATSEDRLARLEDEQTRLAAEAKALSERTVAGGNAGSEARLAAIEAQFAALAASAAKDPSAGPIPQLAALTGKLADLDGRAARATQAAEAAAAGLSGLRADAKRIEEAVGAAKAEAAGSANEARAAREESATLRGTLDGLSAALAPVSGKVETLERGLAAVVAGDESRRANAERILLSLELAGLKRAIERGDGFARELDEVRATSAGAMDLSVLDRLSGQGVASLAGIEKEFQKIEAAILDASEKPANGSAFGWLAANVKSVVRVREIEPAPDDSSPSAVLGRIENALEAGRLAAAIAEARRLPPSGQEAARGWLEKAEARHAVDGAIETIENRLRASLANPSGQTPE